MQPSLILAVALGGAIGAVARYLLAGLLQPAGWSFNWGILAVNVIGGFAMGLIVEASALRLDLTPEMRAFLTVGILGGFTTFSTFSLDSALLLERGAYAAAAGYVGASVIFSVLALFAGLWVVRVFYA